MNRLDYTLKDADSGGFKAIASSPTIDRDNEIIDSFAFAPLPTKIPVHLFHNFEQLAGSAVPYYEKGDLLVDGVFARNAHGREARDLVLAGHLRHMSIAFRGATKKSDSRGIVHIVKGELLSADLVSIPSNREAAVLSARSFNPSQPMSTQLAMARARAQILLVKAYLALHPKEEIGDHRQYIERHGARAYVDAIKRGAR